MIFNIILSEVNSLQQRADGVGRLSHAVSPIRAGRSCPGRQASYFHTPGRCS